MKGVPMVAWIVGAVVIVFIVVPWLTGKPVFSGSISLASNLSAAPTASDGVVVV